MSEASRAVNHRNSVVGVYSATNDVMAGMAEYNAEGRAKTFTGHDGQLECDEVGSAGTVCRGPANIAFGFNSMWRSPVTGFMYMRNRWYSPRLAQFISHDPLGYVDSYNPYQFALFDPVNNWDPYGLSSGGLARKSGPEKPRATIAESPTGAGTKGRLRTKRPVDLFENGLVCGGGYGGGYCPSTTPEEKKRNASFLLGFFKSLADSVGATLCSDGLLHVMCKAVDPGLPTGNSEFFAPQDKDEQLGKVVGSIAQIVVLVLTLKRMFVAGKVPKFKPVPNIQSIRPKISNKQLRHTKGNKEWLKKKGGYVNTKEDAQSVLTAAHNGKVEYLGTTKAGFPVVRYDKVTGFNNNPGAGHLNQPTNVFIIKGTTKPSVVPTSPQWTP